VDNIKIKYTCTAFDYTGYGEAARDYIKSLIKVGAELFVESTDLVVNSAETECSSQDLEMLNSLMSPLDDFDINFIHMSPTFYREKSIADKCNVGMMYWETSHLPSSWVKDINECLDAMFSCCEYTKQSLLHSGVTVPIFVVPPAVDVDMFNGVSPLSLPGIDPLFKFYSIFTWNWRKNPEGLLTAYLTEFNADESAVLIIKSYRGESEDTKLIKRWIMDVKMGLGLSSYPRILLISHLLTADQIKSLHKTGDCFVLPSRSEGLGIPHMNALLAGNPVITTDYGSFPEFVPRNSICLVRCQETPVYGMPWVKEYSGTQWWANPDIMEVSKYMRDVFDNRDIAASRSKVAIDHIHSEYNYNKVGGILSRMFVKVLDG